MATEMHPAIEQATTNLLLHILIAAVTQADPATAGAMNAFLKAEADSDEVLFIGHDGRRFTKGDVARRALEVFAQATGPQPVIQ